jgi:predicted dehydrogenase
MAKTLRVGMIGYRFMGKAHSNAWRQASHFFPLKANVELSTICGRDPRRGRSGARATWLAESLDGLARSGGIARHRHH